MCTVTLIAREKGFCLGMNRDEQISRPIGLPPRRKIVHGRTVLCPSEPGGGTWISLNDAGACLALVNWYSITARARGKTVSRGKIIQAACAADRPGLVEAALGELPLAKINPFRLIGVFAESRTIVVWGWDLRRLIHKKLIWKTRQWISSGFDEPAAQRIRSRIFRQALQERSAGTPAWLRRLHRSHLAGPGPFSTCMHRADAETVSYTEVIVSPHKALIRHHGGPPCENASSIAELCLNRKGAQ